MTTPKDPAEHIKLQGELLDRADAHMAAQQDLIQRQAAEIKALLAERDALRDEAVALRAESLMAQGVRADAERYRWLRERIPIGTYPLMGVIYSEGGAGVDAAIDAAMAKLPPTWEQDTLRPD